MFAAWIAMVQLLGIMGILWCGQVVYSQDPYYALANLNQAREKCDSKRLVLPRTAADNMQVAQRLQQKNISTTWIDLTISPSPWNWITDDEYAVHHDQGCYNFSSLNAALDKITDTNTCMESCAGYLYVGLQAIYNGDNIRCVCTNETDIASAVSEYNCGTRCNVISNRQACGNPERDTFRLLSMRKLSSLLTREVVYWDDNIGLDINSPFLCASFSLRVQNGHRYIRLLPQNCTAELPAICEADNGTVTSLHSVSWFGARQLCRKYGMKSVRVSSPNQTNLLVANIGEGWTALRGWTWRSQGCEICDAVYSNWSARYPKKSEGECIVVLKDGSWKNEHCDTEWPFLCATSLSKSPPAECRSSNPSTSANISDHTNMMEARTTSDLVESTTSDQLATTTSEPRTAATPKTNTTTTSETITTATPETITAATSEPYRDRSSNTLTPTSIINTTSSTDHFTTDDQPDRTSSPGVAVAAAAGSVAFLVLTTVTVIIIICLRKRKQSASGEISQHAQRDPGDDKSLRPECYQNMDEFPIYARPNKDPLTDGVILVVENSLYGSVDLEEDDLQPSRPVAPAISNGRGQGIAVYELAMVSMRDEVNDESTNGQEAGCLSGSKLSMKDQVPDDDTLMIDNSLYDSIDSAMDGLPVP